MEMELIAFEGKKEIPRVVLVDVRFLLLQSVLGPDKGKRSFVWMMPYNLGTLVGLQFSWICVCFEDRPELLGIYVAGTCCQD